MNSFFFNLIALLSANRQYHNLCPNILALMKDLCDEYPDNACCTDCTYEILQKNKL